MGIGLTLLLAPSRATVRAARPGTRWESTRALAASGAVEPAQVIKAVVERGRAMAEAAPAGTSSMARCSASTAAGRRGRPGRHGRRLARQLQHADADGHRRHDGGPRGRDQALQEAGAKRVIPLNVSAAFHTPLMAPAAERLRAALDRIEWRTPRIPVMANLTGRPHQGGDRIPHVMEMQLRSPVRWAACVAGAGRAGLRHVRRGGPEARAHGDDERAGAGRQSGSRSSTPAAVAELAGLIQ